MGASLCPAISSSISNNHSPWLVPHHYTSGADESGDTADAAITDRLLWGVERNGGRGEKEKRRQKIPGKTWKMDIKNVGLMEQWRGPILTFLDGAFLKETKYYVHNLK